MTLSIRLRHTENGSTNCCNQYAMHVDSVKLWLLYIIQTWFECSTAVFLFCFCIKRSHFNDIVVLRCYRCDQDLSSVWFDNIIEWYFFRCFINWSAATAIKQLFTYLSFASITIVFVSYSKKVLPEIGQIKSATLLK